MALVERSFYLVGRDWNLRDFCGRLLGQLDVESAVESLARRNRGSGVKPLGWNRLFRRAKALKMQR
jgi:hypothetical protein